MEENKQCSCGCEATATKTSFFDKPIFHKILGTDPTKPEEMQPKEVMSYSIAGLGQNMIFQIVSAYFMFYLTDSVGLPTMWLAIMFLVERLFDGAIDPFMGTIVDRTRTKAGKMRPYLKWSPIPIAILTILLFCQFMPVDPVVKGQAVPTNTIWAFVVTTVVYCLWSVAYTMVDVPYWGLASSMTSDTNKRNTMLSVARLFCTIGAGIVTILIPVIQEAIENAAIMDVLGHLMADGAEIKKNMIFLNTEEWTEAIKKAGELFMAENPEGVWAEGKSYLKISPEQYSLLEDAFARGYQILYVVAACVVALIAIPTFFIGYKNTKERYYEEDANKAGIGHNLKLLAKNKPILLLIASGILGALRLTYISSALYYAKYNLGNSGLASTITMLIVPGGAIATLTTPWLSKKLGKRNLYIISHLIGGVAMTLLYFVGLIDGTGYGGAPVSMWLFFICVILLGLPSGYSNILQYSMIADSIDYLEDKTGERAEGICFAVQTLISLIGAALVSFTILMALSVNGYDDASKVSAEEPIMKIIWLLTTLISGLSTILCVVPLFFYTFNEKKQAEAVARVAARKAAALAAEGGVAEVEIAEDAIAEDTVVEDVAVEAEAELAVEPAAAEVVAEDAEKEE